MLIGGPLDPENTHLTGGVGAKCIAPFVLVPYEPQGEDYWKAYKSGRLIGCWLKGPDTEILCFNCYGWSGGSQNTCKAQRTDDLISISEEECRHHPSAKCLIIGDFNATEGKLPTVDFLTTSKGWTDCGANASKWGGIDRQATCQANDNAKPSRIDFVLANEAILADIRGFQVDYCHDFKSHHPMQLKLEVGNTVQESDRYRKTPSASKLITEKIDKEGTKNPTVKAEDNRKLQMNALHCRMTQAFEKKDQRLKEAAANGDTTGMWKMISAAIEEGFIGYLGLEGKDAQNMRGRGTPHIIRHTIDPGEPHEEGPPDTGAAALHRIANRHGTQSTRLGHIAAKTKHLYKSEEGIQLEET